MRMRVIRKAAGGSYRRQLAEYAKYDTMIVRALSRAGRRVRTRIVRDLGRASGYPARMLKGEIGFWAPDPNTAVVRWTSHPHAVDRLGWVGRQYRRGGKLTGEVRVKKWPGTGAAKTFQRSFVAPSGRLYSRHKVEGSKPYRVKARGVRRLMDETGLRRRARKEFVGEVRERVGKVLAQRGGR